MATTTAQNPYSPKQHALVAKLADERNTPAAGRTDVEAKIIARFEDLLGNPAVYDSETARFVAGWEASSVIDWLFTLPKRTGAKTTRPEASTEIQPGLYRTDGQVYVVKPNQAKTRLYAKALVEITADRVTDDDSIVQIEYVYSPGAIYKIKPEDRLSFEEAKALNVRYGKCVMCSAKLKAAKSVKAAEENGGFGPVCVTYVR